MNKIILMGRLTREPEVRYTTTGKVVCQFTLAVDRPYVSQGGQREADFINCQAWGKTAEIIGNHVGKGHRLLVEGRLQLRSYTAKDNSKRYATEVVVGSMEFVERKEQAPIGDAAGFSQPGQPGTTDLGSTSAAGFESFGEGQVFKPAEALQDGFKFDEEIPF